MTEDKSGEARKLLYGEMGNLHDFLYSPSKHALACFLLFRDGAWRFLSQITPFSEWTPPSIPYANQTQESGLRYGDLCMLMEHHYGVL